ncbi:crossover junction endodeoxyribonuclease RuvC [Brevundimonas sp. 2R-24]|uniref:Crossover junction endodeoxyribonuclease RuvC n=1 Tax=Peiella sedimenti TaxID=3061083 RepID=A0ABT8SPP9_9CAUL|nr:crossover junction endodeoxyribonuclease RuvC [Caulobacteraceae bacterium XZ-24]
MTAPPMVVMGFHPTTRGFGWVVFETLAAPSDWGLAYARTDKNTKGLHQLRELLEQHRPEYLALEAPREGGGPKSDRLRALHDGVLSLADAFGIAVVLYTRKDISRAILGHARGTRQQVAEAIISHVHAFSHRLPPHRKPWESADRRLALFSAAALALTVYAQES